MPTVRATPNAIALLLLPPPAAALGFLFALAIAPPLPLTAPPLLAAAAAEGFVGESSGREDEVVANEAKAAVV